MRSPRIPSRRTRSMNTEAIPHYNVAVLGDTACGKSSIIDRLISGNFSDKYTPTAAEVYMTTLQNDDKRIASLQLFDTAGGFEFPVMLRLTITKCQAFFVVYSVGSQKSLEIAKRQLEEIANIKGKHFPCVLVGNKKDLDATDEREVSFEKGVQTAVQHGCSYIEISAKDDFNVTEAFCTMVKKIEYTVTIKRRLFSEQRKPARSPSRKRASSMKNFFGHLSNSFSSSDGSDSESDSH